MAHRSVFVPESAVELTTNDDGMISRSSVSIRVSRRLWFLLGRRPEFLPTHRPPSLWEDLRNRRVVIEASLSQVSGFRSSQKAGRVLGSWSYSEAEAHAVGP